MTDNKRMESIKTFIKMRYGRNMNDCMSDMEFMIDRIKDQDAFIKWLETLPLQTLTDELKQEIIERVSA